MSAFHRKLVKLVVENRDAYVISSPGCNTYQPTAEKTTYCKRRAITSMAEAGAVLAAATVSQSVLKIDWPTARDGTGSSFQKKKNQQARTTAAICRTRQSQEISCLSSRRLLLSSSFTTLLDQSTHQINVLVVLIIFFVGLDI